MQYISHIWITFYKIRLDKILHTYICTIFQENLQCFKIFWLDQMRLVKRKSQTFYIIAFWQKVSNLPITLSPCLDCCCVHPSIAVIGCCLLCFRLLVDKAEMSDPTVNWDNKGLEAQSSVAHRRVSTLVCDQHWLRLLSDEIWSPAPGLWTQTVTLERWAQQRDGA